MNTRQIQPKTLWSDSGQVTATILSLFNFTDYHFDNGAGKVHYKLIGMETIQAETPYDVAKEYFTGIVEIPANVVTQWGADDDVIWNYVADNLGITFI